MGAAHADGRAGIDAVLVGRLVATQFPQWAHLPVRPVEQDGWDNRTYRLGDDMSVRLPTAEGYAPAIAKEDRWLPVLAPLLPVAIPEPLATGRPDLGYPFDWSVRRWLGGSTARPDLVGDLPGLAVSVAGFIRALQRIDASGGPTAGTHSFHRGAALAEYDEETRRALAALRGRVDSGAALALWDEALGSTWLGPPVWFHGDVASGNLLVEGGELAAVLDFGTSGVGDPACDLVIAWTFFSGDGRETFRRSVDQDDATWARARGWALWKALIVLAQDIDEDPEAAAVNHCVLDHLLAEG